VTSITDIMESALQDAKMSGNFVPFSLSWFKAQNTCFYQWCIWKFVWEEYL